MSNLNAKLVSAIYRGNQTKVQKLLKKGADVNRLDENGTSPLMLAVLAEHFSMEIVESLVAHGADANMKEPRDKWTVLHVAARDGRTALVKFLLEKNAEVDAVDRWGDTPLWRAVMKFRGDDSVIRLLLSYGADKNLENKSGVSPLSLSQTIAYPGIRETLED